MDKMFDLILIGRGLSNLLFISQYSKTHQNIKILILEKNKLYYFFASLRLSET